jgi:hypothetical protein
VHFELELKAFLALVQHHYPPQLAARLLRRLDHRRCHENLRLNRLKIEAFSLQNYRIFVFISAIFQLRPFP